MTLICLHTFYSLFDDGVRTPMQVAVMIKHDSLRGVGLMWGMAHIKRGNIKLMGLAGLGIMRSIVSNFVCFCTRNDVGGWRGNIVCMI